MNPFQTVFEQQKRHFASGVTRTYQWRIEQLDRMARLVGENEAALQQAIAKDFKTASQEQIFETLACLGDACEGLKNLLLTRCLEVFCNRLLECGFIFFDKPRHAVKLLDAPLIASGRAGCEVALLPIE